MEIPFGKNRIPSGSSGKSGNYVANRRMDSQMFNFFSKFGKKSAFSYKNYEKIVIFYFQSCKKVIKRVNFPNA